MEEEMVDEVMEEEMVDEVMEEEVMEEEPVVGFRGPDQWTVEVPATRAEIEAELEKFRGDSFVFVSWGGAYQAAQRQAYIVPFEAQFGIDVIEESVPTAAKIRAMVETDNIEWHVIDNGTAGAFQLALSGDLEELELQHNRCTGLPGSGPGPLVRRRWHNLVHRAGLQHRFIPRWSP